jgi:serine/threonine protein kinase/TPR repeat protein
MNERTTKIESIYLAVMDLPSPDERERYLNDACADDPALRRKVDALLQSAQAAEVFFQAGREACRVSEAAPVPVLTEKPGDRIGRYKLFQKIGEGGMGVVYMAEQREPVVRKVALKIIKLGMDTRQVVGRFEAERQALALMDHPNIAKVLEAGATETGRPYFVMELVRGIKITEFCDQSGLSTDQRLDLFLQICKAVQHAHQKGIIHRDIKPSNILVADHDGVPVPKIIDFGIAKATNDQQLTDKTVFTAFEQFIGTPVYMSPEQAKLSGLDIDTRTDIYSLGVLLYELLTGKTPFDEKQLLAAGLEEMRRTIREQEPARPSTRLSTMHEGELSTTAKHRHTDPPKLVHRIRGDLDWIVMKCLEKDRGRRYETANGLATDIERHLKNEPVVARPPSATYRFQKLVRRNKLKFATAAFAVTVLLLAVVVSAWQAVKATRAQRQTREQAELARQETEKALLVRDFLVRQLLEINPDKETKPDLGRRALIEQVERAIGPAFTNQPLIEAELRFAVSEAFDALHDRTNALQQMERVLQIRRRELGETNLDTLRALSYTARCYLYIDRHEEGEKLLQGALASVRARPHTLSSGEAEVLWAYGEMLDRDGREDDALPYVQEAMAVSAQTDDQTSWQFKGKQILLARVLGATGRIQESEDLFEEGIRGCERDGYEIMDFLTFEGEFLLTVHHLDRAKAVLERALPLCYQSWGSNFYRTCDVEFLLAQTYELQGQVDHAVALFRGVYPRTVNYFPLQNARRKCISIATSFVRNNRLEDAKSVLNHLTGFFEQNSPSWPTDVQQFGEVQSLLWQVADREGRVDAALGFCRHAAEAGIASAQFNLAERYLFGNGVPRNLAEAFKWYRRESEHGGWAQMRLGLLYAYGLGVAKDPKEARNCFDKGLPQLRQAADQGTAQGLNDLAWVLAMYPLAEVRDGTNAVVLAEKAVVRTSRTNVNFLNILAAAYAEMGDFVKATGIEKEAEARPEVQRVNRMLVSARLISYQAGTPLRLDIVNAQTGIELLIADAVRSKGWPAAAEVCRAHFDAFGDQSVEWRQKALLFAYAGDREWYQKAAGRAIGLAQSAQSVTNWANRLGVWENQRSILMALTCAPYPFTSAEAEVCSDFVKKVEDSLSAIKEPGSLQRWWTIGAMKFRLGRASEGLAQLETVLQKRRVPLERATALLFKSLCLQHLGREKEARDALEDGQKIVQMELPGSLAENEWPLDQDQLMSLGLLREAKALLAESAGRE